MENVEKAIARIMADKVYTSAEFKRERDNFQALCKDLERTEVKILAEGLEVVPLPFELSRCVDLISHDTSNGLLNILHPLGHLCVAHLIDFLDELIVFLPESHLGAGLNSTVSCRSESSNKSLV